MAIQDDIAALKDATAAQDSVIGSLTTFIGGIPALIDAAVAAQEAGDESALQDLKTHIEANTAEISQAVVAGTSAQSPASGVNDDPVTAAAAKANASNAQSEADNSTTYASNGDIVPATPAPAETSDAPAGETPVPDDRVAVDEDHQVPASAATDAAPATPNPDDAPLSSDHVTLEPGETVTVDANKADDDKPAA